MQAAIHGRLRWLSEARPEQITPPSDDWLTWLLIAGRGAGKTRTGAEDVVYYAVKNKGTRTAVVAPTQADLRKTIFEGDSGLLRVIPPICLKGYQASIHQVTLWNGSVIQGFSAEKPDRLRGPQFHRAWCDELAAWQRLQETWDMLQFGLRLGEKPQVLVTTTPRPLQLLKGLLAAQDSIISRTSTHANRKNLAKSFLDKIEQTYGGTRLGRQEIYGEVLSDTPNALWTLSNIDAHRRRPGDVPALQRIVVAIDPAVSNNPGSDETGIITVGKGVDGHAYVLDDASMKGVPVAPRVTGGTHELGWADVAVKTYHSRSADLIVGEVNNGGDMIEALLRSLDGNVAYKAVKASRGKVIRAEPVSALYSRGLVHHVGGFPALEDQMCMFTSDYDREKSGFSPDRMDALVWALTELYIEDTGAAGIFDYFRSLAATKNRAA